MTAQQSEILDYDGETLHMASHPLWDYFQQTGKQPKFKFRGTSLWRGYIGHWAIQDDRLYLVGIDATLADGEPVSLDMIFPGCGERVFAN